MTDQLEMSCWRAMGWARRRNEAQGEKKPFAGVESLQEFAACCAMGSRDNLIGWPSSVFTGPGAVLEFWY